MGTRKSWYTVSAMIIAVGLVAIFVKGISLGIDFLGGTELILRFDNPVAIGEIRTALATVGLGQSEIKTFGSDQDILIRTAEQAEGTVIADTIRTSLQTAFTENAFTILKEDKVGPRIGEELRRDAVYAITATLIVIMIYIGFRFKFVYGVMGVVALFHDVTVTLAIIVLLNGVSPFFNLEMTQNIVAAFLTLIGYSINDKVVVFDRIRENLKLYRSETLFTVLNRSINETLSRTVITGGSVILVLFVLIFFGGEVNRGFAFTFLIGTIIGTYSSIYIASAFVFDWSMRKSKKQG